MVVRQWFQDRLSRLLDQSAGRAQARDSELRLLRARPEYLDAVDREFVRRFLALDTRQKELSLRLLRWWQEPQTPCAQRVIKPGVALSLGDRELLSLAQKQLSRPANAAETGRLLRELEQRAAGLERAEPLPTRLARLSQILDRGCPSGALGRKMRAEDRQEYRATLGLIQFELLEGLRLHAENCAVSGWNFTDLIRLRGRVLFALVKLWAAPYLPAGSRACVRSADRALSALTSF